MASDLSQIGWPESRLGEALEELVKRSRLVRRSRVAGRSLCGPRRGEGLNRWFSNAGAALGVEVEPLSLGYPVNTTGENVFFNPGWDELEGYYAVRRADDPTSNTINMVIELEPEPALLYFLLSSHSPVFHQFFRPVV